MPSVKIGRASGEPVLPVLSEQETPAVTLMGMRTEPGQELDQGQELDKTKPTKKSLEASMLGEGLKTDWEWGENCQEDVQPRRTSTRPAQDKYKTSTLPG